MSDVKFNDIQVRTKNAVLLHDTIQELPGVAAAVIEGTFNGDVCSVRVFAGENFLRFALKMQGYGEVVE